MNKMLTNSTDNTFHNPPGNELKTPTDAIIIINITSALFGGWSSIDNRNLACQLRFENIWRCARGTFISLFINVIIYATVGNYLNSLQINCAIVFIIITINSSIQYKFISFMY